MECTLDAQLWCKLLVSLCDLAKDANIKFHPTHGIECVCMDSAHVALCSFRVHVRDCETFSVAAPLIIGVNLDILSKIAKCNQHVKHVSLKSNDDTWLHLRFADDADATCNDYSIPLMHIEEDECCIPDDADIDFDAYATLASKVWEKKTRDATLMGEFVHIKTTAPGILHLNVSGDYGNCQFNLQKSDQVDVEGSCDGHQYALKYLTHFNKARALSDRVQIAIGASTPLRVRYTFGESGTMDFFLSPCLDEH